MSASLQPQPHQDPLSSTISWNLFLCGPVLTFIHHYWKNHSFDYTDLGKVMSLLFNMLSKFVMGFPGGSVVKNLPANEGNAGLS